MIGCRPTVGRPVSVAESLRAHQPPAPKRDGSSHALVTGCGSALARRGRGAEGGTPDPCQRDHPARPGVKLEPPQPPVAAWPSPAVGAGGEEERANGDAVGLGWERLAVWPAGG